MWLILVDLCDGENVQRQTKKWHLLDHYDYKSSLRSYNGSFPNAMLKKFEMLNTKGIGDVCNRNGKILYSLGWAFNEKVQK